jgi:chromosome segregation ATPase
MPKLTEQDRLNIDNNVIRLTQEKSELIQIRDQLSNERATFTQEATIRLKYTEQQNKVKELEQSILQIKAEVKTLSSHGQIQPAGVKDRLNKLNLKLQSLEQELDNSKQAIEELLQSSRRLQHKIVYMS